MTDIDPNSEVTVKDKPPLLAWIGLLVCTGLVFVTPVLMAAAGTERVQVWNPITYQKDKTTWAWALPLEIGVAALALLLISAVLILHPTKAFRANREQARLRGKIKSQTKWEEVDRVVLWNKRVKRLGVIPIWEPQIGIVNKSERTRNFDMAASARRWEAKDLRANGVPAWLPGGIQKHSVRLSHRRAPAVAAAVAQFAPHLRVIDQRHPNQPTQVKPDRGKTTGNRTAIELG
ncbi:hypothetical protein [Natronoglycomyces albus]|uniref:Uncharacterized protein n=1 Tax=Natronoglycomyces albus TaxID=2811108 RepID=A0A895XQ69_9ACTN|nr:hypothetical protein [Natronoglycomyces albus]QSB05519.1 hypothetical protein JQS30_00825 [Natronoglycomyces albus]